MLENMANSARPPDDFGKTIPNKENLTLKEAAPYLGYKNVESFRRAIREGRSPVKHSRATWTEIYPQMGLDKPSMVLAAEVMKKFPKVFLPPTQHRTTPRYTGTTIDNNVSFDNPKAGPYSAERRVKKRRETVGLRIYVSRTRLQHEEVLRGQS